MFFYIKWESGLFLLWPGGIRIAGMVRMRSRVFARDEGGGSVKKTISHC